MTLLFTPAGVGDSPISVPVAKVDWSWSYDAQYDGNNWTLRTAKGAGILHAVHAIPTTLFPTWLANVVGCIPDGFASAQ